METMKTGPVVGGELVQHTQNFNVGVPKRNDPPVEESYFTRNYKPAPSIAPPIPISIGDFVRWFSPTHQQQAAVVSQINADGSLCLTVFPTPGGARDMALLDQTRMRVFHRSFMPEIPEHQTAISRYGTWDLTECEIARRAREERDQNLIAQLITKSNPAEIQLVTQEIKPKKGK